MAQHSQGQSVQQFPPEAVRKLAPAATETRLGGGDRSGRSGGGSGSIGLEPDIASVAEEAARAHRSADGADPSSDPATDPLAADPSGSTESSLRLVAERPITSSADDRLGYQTFAEAISSILVDSRTDTPLTICVSGPWGAGKTSLVNLVRSNLTEAAKRTDTSPLVLDFNAWHHEAADDLGSALAASVARDLNRYRGYVRRLCNPLPGSMLGARALLARRGLRFVVFLAAVLGLVLALYRLGPVDEVDKQLGLDALPGIPLVVVLGLWVWGHVNSLNQTLGAFFRSPKAEAGRGTMAEVRNQLHQLIGHVVDGPLRRSPVIIVIDDLDRVAPRTAIGVCETVTQLLDRPGIVVILVADILTLEAAAEVKYPEGAAAYRLRPGTTGAGRYLPESYGRAFMQKLVNFQVGLPPATSEQLREVASTHVSRQPDSKPADSAGLFRRLASFPDRQGLSMLGLRAPDRDTARKWLDSLGAVFYGVLAAVLGTMAVLFAVVALGSPARDWTGSAVVGLLFVSAIGALRKSRDQAQEVEDLHAARHEARRVVDRLIGQAVGANPVGARVDTEAILTDLEREIAAKYSPAVTGKVLAELAESIAEIVAELVAVDSVARRQAEKEITAYFLPLPRGVKRLVNQLRFLLYVAQRNGLLDPEDVTPERVGKWAVFGERWPDLSAAIEQDPALLAELEELSTRRGGAFTRRMASFEIPGLCADPSLQDFLSREPLGPVAEKLVYLRHCAPEETALEEPATVSAP